MKITTKPTKLLLLLLLSFGALTLSVHAGEDEKMTEEHVKKEVSYWASKLLEITGEESYTLESEAYEKPFIGICSAVEPRGVVLTCVTPGTQAKKSGLLTGDVVTAINGKSISGSDMAENKEVYYEIVTKMKTGDVLTMALDRGEEKIEIDVTVGSINHPRFVLQVGK